MNPERLPGATRHRVPQPQQPLRDARHVPPGDHRAAPVPRRALKLTIDPRVLAALHRRLAARRARRRTSSTRANVFAQGQSMGGMYTNLISAVEPRIRAAVPTGAGGYWSHFILITPLIPGRRRRGGHGAARHAATAHLPAPRRSTSSRPPPRRSTRWCRCRASRAARSRATRCGPIYEPVGPGRLVLPRGDLRRDGDRVRPQGGGARSSGRRCRTR